MMTTVLIDQRERDLIAAMHDSPVTWRTASLDVGDVHFTSSEDGAVLLVLERKTLRDWAASMSDGRYREQKARLLSAHGAACVAYVLETADLPRHDSGGDSGLVSPFGNVTNAALVSSLVATQARDGLRVIHTADVADTAAFIRVCAERASRRDTSPREFFFSSKGGPAGTASRDAYAATCSLASRKRQNVDVRHCYLQQLAQVPGVSVAMASSIAQRFGTMRELVTQLSAVPPGEATKALASLALIGKRTAQRVVEYLILLPSQEGAAGPLAPHA